MPLMFGAGEFDAMNRLHAAFDPDGGSNPGKVLPAASAPESG